MKAELVLLSVLLSLGDNKSLTCKEPEEIPSWAKEPIYDAGNHLPLYFRNHVLLTKDITWFWVDTKKGFKYKLHKDSACQVDNFDSLKIHFNARNCIYNFNRMRLKTEECRCETRVFDDRFESRVGVSADTGDCTVYISFFHPSDESRPLDLRAAPSEIKKSLLSVKDRKLAYDVLMPRIYPFSPPVDTHDPEAEKEGMIANIAIGVGSVVFVIAIISVILLYTLKGPRKFFQKLKPKRCCCRKKQPPPPPTPTPSATPVAPISTAKTGTSVVA